MAKVTYHATKGLVVESGTGFQVNDAPVLEEIEAVTATGDDDVELANFGVSSITTHGDGDVDIFTLPDGDAAGQLKTIVIASQENVGDYIRVNDEDGGDIIGDNLKSAGDYAHLLWTGDAWVVISEVTTA
jgi:hypothetical protein